MSYRDDIDGLRAVAVLLIVFFHARLANVPGGFIGVDVFFVISGFLITGLLTREIADGRFRFRAFYMRRLRRLGPALLATIAFTLLAGWFILPPTLYQTTAQSALATLFSVSNVFFWHQVGYFDVSAAYKPLLHTWSLAVEEQFYFIWPALVLLAVKRLNKSGLIFALIIVSAVSLLFSQALLASNSSAAFFLTPFRMFEFSAGALLAVTSWQARNPLTANGASLAGLLIIFYLAGSYGEHTPFPGVNAAIPTVATAMMIYAGPTAVMNRALALAPIRYIGRISYSVYLVHWPLFVYYIFVYGEAGTSASALILIGLALLLGAVMYHLIETPFRTKSEGQFNISARALGLGSVLTATLIAVASWQIHLERGYASRFPPRIIELLAELDKAIDARTAGTREFTCNATRNSVDVYFDIFVDCLPDQRDNLVVVLGDSHAADAFMGLKAAYPDTGFVQLTGNGCNMIKSAHGDSFCAQFLQLWQVWLRENASVLDAIVFTQSGGSLVARGPGGIERPNPSSFAVLSDNLSSFAVEGVPLYFWGPRLGFEPSIEIAIVGSETPDEVRRYYADRANNADFVLDELLQDHFAESDIRYISTLETLCQPLCPTLTDDGALFIVDHAHWSLQGATVAAQKLVAADSALSALLVE